MEFKRQTTCGELIVFIEDDNGKYKIKTLMKKFGDCSAYKFIGKIIEEKLNNSEDISDLVEELKTYKCALGEDGCIDMIGDCIEEFFKED